MQIRNIAEMVSK